MEFHSLHTDLSLHTKLLDFLPELDLNITPNPVACNLCTATISQIHEFKRMCIRNENVLKKQSEEICNGNIKKELDEGTINTEEIVKNEYILINTEESASYYCNQCLYYTNNKESLIDHMATHQFKCNQCDFTTSFNWSLKAHEETHSNSKRMHEQNQIHKCKLCSYSSSKQSNLMAHIRRHAGNKVLKCNLCDYRSTFIANLRQHMFKHSGKWPYNCDECNYKTHSRYSYNQHKRTHTGEKPLNVPCAIIVVLDKRRLKYICENTRAYCR
ncbi:hypothetical protein FQR65_LT03517 [Abscondita terminalis]|nr:hypothetical protein FQR65_LT03517 [Abscondita terminalis]